MPVLPTSSKSTGTRVAIAACILLMSLAIVFGQNQILSVSETKVFDKKYIHALEAIGLAVPSDESIGAARTIPQLEYFSNHDVVWIRSGFSSPTDNFAQELVEYMWNRNCSYLILTEDRISEPQSSDVSEDGPLPFEIQNPYPKTKIEILDRVLTKVGKYETESSLIHLYFLDSSVTSDNLRSISDFGWPKLSVDTPVNGTTIITKGYPVFVNVTGTANDPGSGIKTVEVSAESPFNMAQPKSSEDWSEWSYSYPVNMEGTTKIVVRTSDNANHTTYQVILVTVRYSE
jgi:hypothetical protein